MSVPTPINLNDSTPPAPLGGELIHWLADTSIPRNVSAYTRALGGAVVHTASYTALLTDDKKLLSFNITSAATLTLPNPPPKATYSLFVQNIGSAVLTVDPNGLTLDTKTGTQTVQPGSGFYVTTDGTNYFSEGDAFNASLLHPPYHLVFEYVGKPAAGGILGLFCMPSDLDATGGVTLTTGLTTSRGNQRVLPTASVTLTVNKIRGTTTSTFATMTVSTAGLWTFSPGASSDLIGGDFLVAIGPTPADATFQDFSFTLAGKR